MRKLTTRSTHEEVDQFLRELAYSPYTFHIDDDPNDIIWNPHHVPSSETLQLLVDNRQALIDHTTMSWDLIWNIYGAYWKQASREHAIRLETLRLLEQFGLVDSTDEADQDDHDAAICEEWTCALIDAMNRA